MICLPQSATPALLSVSRTSCRFYVSWRRQSGQVWINVPQSHFLNRMQLVATKKAEGPWPRGATLSKLALQGGQVIAYCCKYSTKEA